MPVEPMFGNLTREETLEELGIPDADDPKLSALAATSWGGNGLKVLQVNATENGWQFAAIVGLTDGDKGDITVSASGATWTIDNGAVTLAKQANVATSTVFYRKTAGAGAPEVQTLATLKTDLGLTGTNSGDQTITLTGDVTGSGTGSFTATVAARAVDFAKFQAIGTGKVLGRAAAGSGDVEELATTGTGNAVFSASPTLTGTFGAVSAVFSGTVTTAGLSLVNNQNATTTFAVQNTDTTNSSSRGQVTIQGGSTSIRILALSGSTAVLGTTTASDWQFQRNNAVIATLAAAAVNINTGISLQMNSADVITSARHPVLRSYTVATLPAANDGELAFASNGRKTGEGAGAGTGVMVYRDGGTWFRSADDTAVAA